MMEMMGRNSDYFHLAQQGVQLNLNSALCSLVTPPRCNNGSNNKRTTQFKRKTPSPTKLAENLSKSLPKNSVTRNSPSRLSPSQLQGKDFYAGAKFGERPPPTELPKPPNHWVSENRMFASKEQSCLEMTNNLKVLLKVQS